MTATASPPQSTGIATGQDWLVSHDPATGAEVGRVRVTTPDDVAQVVQRARAAQPQWGATSPHDRARVMVRAARVLFDGMDEVATLISTEQGKPQLEALLHDVSTGIEHALWCASDVPKLLRPERVRSPQLTYRAKKHVLHYEPLGVVGIISPWNFPFGIPFSEVAIALACGNAVVLKPSELTPLAADEIARVFADAGLPDGVLQVIQGDGRVGGAPVAAGVDKIFFTGSVGTGRAVMRAAADTLTPVVLELGGKDPMIVLEDADVDLAARGAVWGAFANAGQVCASVERAYVHESVSPQFIDKVVQQAAAMRTGSHDEPDVDLGPLVSQRQYEIVKGLVDDAVAGGARILTGGPDPRGGWFYRPTVLVDVRPDMRIMREEIFGPVLPVVTVRSEDEAVSAANDSDFGLSASVWTRSTRRALDIAERLQAGSVWVNDHMYSHNAPQLPWGGVKQSGFGRTHSKLGVYECVQVKMVGRDSGRMPRPYYFPYASRQAKFVPTLLRAMYGRGLAGRIASALRRLPS
ncbi:MAG TPA: aldehyde dehydrogenase family protein [Candidatus Angelobacter sp.]|jgi:acyl-CoA reductase-like NAD-dependent aldehyde dehydrogenase|nr:aldehyde dehydrogenase family protein [Candidatus Angelobacter sp.]